MTLSTTFTDRRTAIMADWLNAVNRRVFSDCINVLDYMTDVERAATLARTGADVTGAINAALTALYARGGGILFFPAGEYLFTTFDVSRTYNVILQGEGNSDTPQSGATVLRCTKRGGLTDVAISVTGGGTSTNALQSFRDMNITGGTVNEVGINSTSVTTVNNGIGVKFNISHRVEMVNVSVFGFAKYGVEYSGGTFYGVFNNCLFQYNGQYGFWSDESNTTTLLACHFHYNGIGLRPNDFLLLGCIFQGNASHAISLEVNLNLHMIGCYFEVNNLCDQAVGADVFADSAVSVNVHCQDSEFHGTYDSNDFATNNFRGRFATLMFSGCNKFPTMATYYNVFGITTCKIYDRSAPPLCRSATSRFIDQSTSTTLYICPPCPDGDRQVTAATSATVALAPSSQSLELSAASAQNVDTITALNSTQGRVLIVNLTDSDVTLKDGSGNLRLAGDFTGGAGGNDMILLWKNGTLWREISRSVN